MYLLGGRSDYMYPPVYSSRFWKLDLRGPSSPWTLIADYSRITVYPASAGDPAAPGLHPGPRFGSGAVIDYNFSPGDVTLWLFGGSCVTNGLWDSVNRNDVWYYSVNSGLWRWYAGTNVSNAATPLQARSHMGMWLTPDGSSLMIAGGLQSGYLSQTDRTAYSSNTVGTFNRSVLSRSNLTHPFAVTVGVGDWWQFDIASRNWALRSAAFPKQHAVSSLTDGDRFCVFGGAEVVGSPAVADLALRCT
jgi:hypothetical protein